MDVAIDLLPAHACGRVAAAAVQQRVHLVNTFYTVPEVKDLATQAESRNVTILPEFGLDLGIDLVMLGEAVRSLDEVEEIWSYGGGIPEPEAASNPLKYKVTWMFDQIVKQSGAGSIGASIGGMSASPAEEMTRILRQGKASPRRAIH